MPKKFLKPRFKNHQRESQKHQTSALVHTYRQRLSNVTSVLSQKPPNKRNHSSKAATELDVAFDMLKRELCDQSGGGVKQASDKHKVL